MVFSLHKKVVIFVTSDPCFSFKSYLSNLKSRLQQQDHMNSRLHVSYFRHIMKPNVRVEIIKNIKATTKCKYSNIITTKIISRLTMNFFMYPQLILKKPRDVDPFNT